MSSLRALSPLWKSAWSE